MKQLYIQDTGKSTMIKEEKTIYLDLQPRGY